jgi:hypothetical protein
MWAFEKVVPIIETDELVRCDGPVAEQSDASKQEGDARSER